MSDFFVRFLTRPGCHLCEEAYPLVVRACRLTGTRVESVDITRDPEVEVLWDLRIPVVLDPGGRVLDEGRLGMGRLVRAILRSRIRPGH